MQNRQALCPAAEENSHPKEECQWHKMIGAIEVKRCEKDNLRSRTHLRLALFPKADAVQDLQVLFYSACSTNLMVMEATISRKVVLRSMDMIAALGFCHGSIICVDKITLNKSLRYHLGTSLNV